MSTLYDTDFYAWTQEQVALLEGKHFDAIDLGNLIEEIADLGRSEKRAMGSYFDVLVLHLLKWLYQPQQQSGSWRGSITDARQQIAKLGRDNPSLRPQRRRMLEECYPDARRVAAAETALDLETFPETCPWDLEREVLSLDFFPV